eukprot:2894077-Lingulodinium_polyedra.AAC.1
MTSPGAVAGRGPRTINPAREGKCQTVPRAFFTCRRNPPAHPTSAPAASQAAVRGGNSPAQP